MQIFGKLIGGGIGLYSGHIPGLILGLIVGHIFDRSLQQTKDPFAGSIPQRGVMQAVFFQATFLVMGKLAKADGRVSEHELQAARSVMTQMGLNETQRMEAMKLFTQGKTNDFDISEILSELRDSMGRRSSLTQIFLEIQLQTAYSDGKLHSSERIVLQSICQYLNINKLQFELINQRVYAQQQFNKSRRQYQQQNRQQGHQKTSFFNDTQLLDKAYASLGVKKTSSLPDIKKAYRRLMNQHHPDKLVAKGLPQEMMQLAKEKTQEIQTAYEMIKKSRKR
ncbi:MAG: co-chaperone DjlA [Saccharospirillaceae bacterium]|nr:co-chaperone DjlA [Pseudomonadales bacterium]NRB80472.1 co-chaperone DjlA [Saccharospirillaceae bacterium]